MIGFDNDKYLQLQSENIVKRIGEFGGKLYLEFGGKLFDDYHASRVLPGFHPDSKVRMLLKLKDEAEIVMVISANDIEKNKVRGDLGITYDLDALRSIDALREIGLYVGCVVITHYCGQPAADAFEKRLESLGVKVYRHYIIADYPNNLPLIVSDEGFGKNDYIETTRSLVVITAPGPGSGKMAVCLSQLYHDHIRGISSGYSKFETFPIWNLPLSHPVNLAYEAATADLDDVNMIDPYHLEAYGQSAVNYNRDVEVFPVLGAILDRIMGSSPYKSPTDMGVNMVGFCIVDDDVCREASKQEVIRRYYAAACKERQGMGEAGEVSRLELIMSKLNISKTDRPTVNVALRRSEETENQPAVALQLPDGRMVTGKTTSLLGPSAAALINALKELAGIPNETELIAPSAIKQIQALKTGQMGSHNPRLHTDEVLIAMAICAATDPQAAAAMAQLSNLKGAEAHATVILSRVDENVFQKLGVNVTCEPQYQTEKLYHN